VITGRKMGRPVAPVDKESRHEEAAECALDQELALVEHGDPGVLIGQRPVHQSGSRPTSMSAARTAVAMSASGSDCFRIRLLSAE
jgi:hypothetical protein